MRTIRDNFEAGQAKIRLQNEDARRGEFLRAIDGAEETLSDFEIEFLGSFLKWAGTTGVLRPPDLDFRWFTPGRRAVVDGMIHRYGMRSLKSEVQGLKSKLPEATAGCCGYLVRNDETNRRDYCGRPATSKSPRGLELCDEHTSIRAAELAHLRAAKERLRR